MTRRRNRTRILGIPMALLLLPVGTAAAESSERACSSTSNLLARACRHETKEDGLVALSDCLNLADPEESEECREEVAEELREARGECREQRDARRDVCEAVGEAPYDPEIDPANFVEGIDNPYTPFAVGSRWVYAADTEDGVEEIVVEVLDETFEILGVECTVVRDRVYLDGELTEDTLDWLAQDVDGNVWYFGEISKNFEDGMLHDLDGSWLSGVEGAKPGYWMKAAPVVGEWYRQEYMADEAEDVAEVISLDAQVAVPFDNGSPILQTRDFTPLEPDVEEFKFFVPGVGMVLEVDPESGEMVELVEYTP